MASDYFSGSICPHFFSPGEFPFCIPRALCECLGDSPLTILQDLWAVTRVGLPWRPLLADLLRHDDRVFLQRFIDQTKISLMQLKDAVLGASDCIRFLYLRPSLFI